MMIIVDNLPRTISFRYVNTANLRRSFEQDRGTFSLNRPMCFDSFLRSYLFGLAIVRECEPGHFTKIFLKSFLVSVWTDKYNLQNVFHLLAIFIECCQLRCKVAARWTPMCREIYSWNWKKCWYQWISFAKISENSGTLREISKKK